MGADKENGVSDDKHQRPTLPSPKLVIRHRKDTSDLRPGSRSLRRAVLLLAEKVESLGVDVSDVTEMIGADRD